MLFIYPFVHVFSPGEHKSEAAETQHPNNNNGPVAPLQNQLDPQNTNNAASEHVEQDADDEAAEDTDDTRSDRVPFSSAFIMDGWMDPSRIH